MTASAEDILDRRLLRRRLTFWRGAAIGVAALAIVGIGLASMDRLGGMRGDHILRIPVSGTILNNRDLAKTITDAAEDDAVKAIIIAIDSPGGTTVGGEALHEAVKTARAAKPVVAQVATLAASAGYMVASAAEHIVARESSIVGSIGVLVQMPNVSTLMNRIGVSVDEVKSSPLKAEPNFMNPTNAAELAMMQRMIDDSYDWFVTLVMENRGMERAEVLALADGSVFTGRQAKANGLVDSLGGEKQALKWLAQRGVPDDLAIIDAERRAYEPLGLFGHLAAALLPGGGLDAAASRIAGAAGLDAVFLDGLVSLWQGSERNPNGGSGQVEGLLGR